MGCDVRNVLEVWATGERRFYELFPSYRRKSFIVKLELRTKCLFGCTNYRDFRRFFSPPKKPKNAGCFGKNAGMREITKFAGFPARLRDGWHLCVQGGDSVLKHAYLSSLCKILYCNTCFGCFRSQLIHLDMFQSNQSPFSASKIRH